MMNVFLIGNGESRKELDLNKLKLKGKVYGCNALYRDFTPDVLISVDHGIMHEIYHSGYAYKNETWFRDWNKLPGMMYDTLVQTTTENDIVKQNDKTGCDEFVMHGANMEGEATILRKDGTTYKKNVKQNVTTVSWVRPDDKVKNINDIMPGNRDIGWASGALTGYIACNQDKPDVAYLIGHDLVSDTDTVNNMYKGTSYYKIPESKPVPPQNWITQWKQLFESNPNTKFIKVNLEKGDSSNPIDEWKTVKNLEYINYKQLDETIK